MTSKSAISGTTTLEPIGSRRIAAYRDLIFAVLLSTAFVILLCLIFNPRWETNDDVAMSMVAHGYGGAAYGSPRLIFSNVVWGIIVRALPTIDGLLGYSIATLLSLTIGAAATTYFLLRSGAGAVVSTLVLVFIFMRPVLFPQFTITAGLLAVAMLLGLRICQRDDSPVNLVAACCLGFLAYLIRAQEFALVIAVALPLLHWRKLFSSRAAWMSVSGLAICIVAATAIDAHSYSAPDWQAFWETNFTRAPFTDYRAMELVLRRPDLLQHYGLSENDVRLVGNWFFVDPKLSDPKLLRALLSEISVQGTLKEAIAFGLGAISLAAGHALLPLTLTGIVILFVFINSRFLLAWVICFAAIFAIGAAGRADVVRVYVPLFTLLVVISCARSMSRSRWRHFAVICTLLVGAIGNALQLREEAAASDRIFFQARAERFVSAESTLIWGASFPFEYFFPVFTRTENVKDSRIYGLGVFTLAPFSVASEDERTTRGLLARLQSEAGVPLIATSYYESLLNTYCTEHYGTHLRLTASTKTSLWEIKNASCPPPAEAD
ncbi:hypothetical protein [Bradyrhizobium lablabi]|uniref:hypothetical protein n=1 Tax=Bradyrhizobium lablabi TaxID=722472 RepID=UPI00090B3093|nr:hypothetical protein [Bradyrhizobium lablabi]SHM81274.1 hypothetical protein SAMN05444321_7701 [Bradyrhizobium lablabi]